MHLLVKYVSWACVKCKKCVQSSIYMSDSCRVIVPSTYEDAPLFNICVRVKCKKW